MKMDEIDLKFDKFLEQYNGDMRVLLSNIHSALNGKSIESRDQNTTRNCNSIKNNDNAISLTSTIRLASNSNLMEPTGVLTKNNFAIATDLHTENEFKKDYDKIGNEILPFGSEFPLNESSSKPTSYTASSIDSKKVSYRNSSSEFTVEEEDSINFTKSEELLREPSSNLNLLKNNFHSENLNETEDIAKPSLARKRSFN